MTQSIYRRVSGLSVSASLKKITPEFNRNVISIEPIPKTIELRRSGITCPPSELET